MSAKRPSKRRANAKRHPFALAQLSAPIILLTAVYAVILFIQLYLHNKNTLDSLWIQYFKHVSAQRLHFIVYGAAAFIVILSILVLSKRIGLKSNKALTVVLVTLVFVSTIEMRHVGARMWTPSFPGKTQQSRIKLDANT